MCHIQRLQKAGGVASVKCEVQAQILNMLQTWQLNFCPSQSQWERKETRKKEWGEKWQGAGRNSNQWPGKWPAMLSPTELPSHLATQWLSLSS